MTTQTIATTPIDFSFAETILGWGDAWREAFVQGWRDAGGPVDDCEGPRPWCAPWHWTRTISVSLLEGVGDGPDGGAAWGAAWWAQCVEDGYFAADGTYLEDKDALVEAISRLIDAAHLGHVGYDGDTNVNGWVVQPTAKGLLLVRDDHCDLFCGELQAVRCFLEEVAKNDLDPLEDEWIYRRIESAIADPNVAIHEYQADVHGERA
jgi:hypothetical protein